MRYTLRQLEVFLATARYENISRAAEALAMSQSAASGSLKALESQFNVQLFDRVGKQLRLNPFGAQLRPEAQQVLDQASALEVLMANEQVVGTISVGATLTIGNYLTLDMIAQFQSQHREARVKLDIANTRDIVRRVAEFELDVGLVEGEVHDRALHTEHWRQDELVVFAAAGHPLASAKAVDDTALAALPWIVREPGSGTRQTFDRAMRGILPDLTIAMELEQPKAIKHAVEVGLGVGCLSAITVEDAFTRGTLVPLRVPHRDFSREWFIVTHRKKFQSRTLQAWLAHCREDWSTP